MLKAPDHDGVEDRQEIFPHFRKPVLYMRRDLIELFPDDQAILLQIAQGVGQHGIGDAGQVFL